MTYNCYIVLTTAHLPLNVATAFLLQNTVKNMQYPRGPSYGIQCHPNVYAYYMSAIIGLF